MRKPKVPEIDIGFFDSIDGILKVIDAGGLEEGVADTDENTLLIPGVMHSAVPIRKEILCNCLNNLWSSAAEFCLKGDEYNNIFAGSKFDLVAFSESDTRIVFVPPKKTVVAQKVLETVSMRLGHFTVSLEYFDVSRILMGQGNNILDEEAFIFSMPPYSHDLNLEIFDLRTFLSFFSGYVSRINERKPLSDIHELITGELSRDQIVAEMSLAKASGRWCVINEPEAQAAFPVKMIEKLFAFELAFNPFENWRGKFEFDDSDSAISDGPASMH